MIFLCVLFEIFDFEVSAISTYANRILLTYTVGSCNSNPQENLQNPQENPQGLKKFDRTGWAFNLCEFDLKEFSCKG